MRISRLAVGISLSVLLAISTFGQDAPQATDPGAPDGQTQPPPPPLNPDQLQNLVAPIALYPDTLLSQILVASTYPIEVVEAQQWLQQNHNLKGQQLLDAARQQDWDPSIQALVPFPDVLTRLNQDIRWTTDLGNAFLAQQQDVMNAVQQLRAKAQANGKLQTTEQQNVTTQTDNGQTAIQIQPPNPEVVYVPVYNPAWVWGPPVFGYYPPLFYPGIGLGFSFLPGIDLGFYFGGGWGLWGGYGWGWGPDWFGGRIILNDNFFHRYGFRDYHPAFGHDGVWAHDPGHRLGVPYPNRTVASRYRDIGGVRGSAARGAEGFRGTEGTRGAAGTRGAEGSRGAEAGGRSFTARPEAPASRSAFGGIQNGSTTRMQSDHGFSSIGRSSGGFGGGGGGFHGVAVEVAGRTVVEAGDNMIAKTFTLVFVVAVGTAFAQTAKPTTNQPKTSQKTFESPQAATQALIDAASKNDGATLTAVLGTIGQRPSDFGRCEAR